MNALDASVQSKQMCFQKSAEAVSANTQLSDSEFQADGPAAEKVCLQLDLKRNDPKVFKLV